MYVPTSVAVKAADVYVPSPLTATGVPTWLVVPSGAVSVNVIVPPGLSPPVTFADR